MPSRSERRLPAATPLRRRALRIALKRSAQPLRLRVVTDICPQVAIRVLGLLAQRDLVPRAVAVDRGRDCLSIALALDGLAAERLPVLLARIAAVVGVRSVRSAGRAGRHRPLARSHAAISSAGSARPRRDDPS